MNSDEFKQLQHVIKTLSGKILDMSGQTKELQVSLDEKNAEITRLRKCKNYSSYKQLPTKTATGIQSRKKLPKMEVNKGKETAS